MVTESQTFTPQAGKLFDLSYADGTELQGFNAHDIVHLGDFHSMAPFGLLYSCNSPDFNGVDGIIGFGLPKPGMEGKQLPRPVLWALTDKDPSDFYAAAVRDSNAQKLHRKFSFFSTDDAAEVQLGGYDPATCQDMYYTPSLSPTDFIVGVTSVKFGKGPDDSIELLQFNDPTGAEYLPAIMDSGTSCLVLPGDDLDGKLSNVPFDDFSSLWAKDKSFYLTIGGKSHEVPFSSWFLERTNQTCVQPSPSGMQGLLIGDIFFRSYMVEFDMEDERRPIIGIAKLNANYLPVNANAMSYFDLHRTPVQKLSLLRGEETMYPAAHSTLLEQVDQIPIFNKKGTQYFMDVAVGEPAQKFTVIFDTGSAVFGIFTRKEDLPASILNRLDSSTALKVQVGAMNALMVWKRVPQSMILSAADTRAATLAMASAELSKHFHGAWTGGSSLSAVNGESGVSWLAAVALGFLIVNVAAIAAVVRYRRGRKGHRYCQLEQVPSGQSYGAVMSVTSNPC